MVITPEEPRSPDANSHDHKTRLRVIAHKRREALWELPRPELRAAWDSLHRGTSPDKIAPLE